MFQQNDDSHEFKPLLAEIEDEPINPLGRVVFWIIISTIIFFSLWYYFGKVDIVVTARGKVLPAGEIKILQPLTTGSVSKILVKEGDYVKKGDVLMEIDPSDTEPELSSMNEDAKKLELELIRLDAGFNQKPFQPEIALYGTDLIAIQEKIYMSSLNLLEKQIQAKKEELKQIKEQRAAADADRKRLQALSQIAANRLERLGPVRDLIRKDLYDQAQSEFNSYKGSFIAAGHKVKELQAAFKRIENEISVIIENERDKTLIEIAEKKNKLNYLKARIEKTTFINAKQQLVAPVDGFINKLLIHTIGGVVSPAEKLIAIVPANSPLIIRALVQNKDIGFIEHKMKARIKVDTFSFQKYGTIDGEISHVAHDSVEDKEQGLVYEVYVKPDKTSLLVEGVSTPITSGMSTTAEIKVGKRRIIEFFIYPLIKYLDEGISVR